MLCGCGVQVRCSIGRVPNRFYFHENNAPVSWKSVKETVMATSTNHSQLLAFHEASRELVWLQTMDDLIMRSTPLENHRQLTALLEDEVACVTQMGARFIKADQTKHIDLHIFSFSQDLVRDKQMSIMKVASSNNIADLLTKVLLGHWHHRLVHMARMRLLHDIQNSS